MLHERAERARRELSERGSLLALLTTSEEEGLEEEREQVSYRDGSRGRQSTYGVSFE